MNKKLFWLVQLVRAGGVLAVLFLVFSLATPGPVSAQSSIHSTTPSSVFTGRFIPAFVGGAYDPSEAYAAMAGLPVYVVAFDNWRGNIATGDQTFIIGDLAVRTQIRADGTFQVQGLPEGQIFGVYFPFTYTSAGVVRTDCVNTSTNSAERNFNHGDDRNPCHAVADGQSFPFYMPRPEDKIIDVFSYAAEYATTEASNSGVIYPLQSQVESVDHPGEFEQVALEHVFLTNRKELDIANNINTFPLMPASAIEVNIQSLSEAHPGTYNVWAIRVSEATVIRDASGAIVEQTLRPVYSPIIKGRFAIDSERLTYNSYTFQSYAPRGDYVVIVWQESANSPSYDDWDGKSSLATYTSAIAQMTVDLEDNNEHSWRDRIENFNEYMIVYPNSNWMWGTVTTENGNLFSDFSWKLIGTDHESLYDRLLLRANNVVECSSNGATEIWDLMGVGDTANNDVFVTPLSDIHDNLTPFLALRGVYIIREFRDASAGCSAVPHSTRINVEVDTTDPTLKSYRTSFTDSGTIYSVDGPIRKDIVVKKSAVAKSTGNTISGGYDSGIYMKLENKVGGDTEPYVGTVTVLPINTEESLPVRNKTYYLSDNGELYIPASDLSPSVSEKYEDLSFLLYVNDGFNISFFKVGNGSDEFPWLSPLGTSSPPNTGLVQVCAKGVTNPLECNGPFQLDFTQVATERPDRYNLALLNKVDKLIDSSALAADSSPIPVRITDYATENFEGDIVVEVRKLRWSFLKNYRCGECKFELPDGTVIGTVENGTAVLSSAEGFEGTFNVIVPRASSKDLSWACNANAVGLVYGGEFRWDEILEGCDIINEKLINTRAFKLKISAIRNSQPVVTETEIVVNDKGELVSAPPELTLTYDCREYADQLETDGGWKLVDFEKSFARISCSAGQFMSTKIDTFFEVIQDYGLSVAPLTRSPLIIRLFNVSRNLVNILFVVIFIIMSIMTILRYQPEQWHTRVILPKLLIALVLANFSILIVQGMLDLNNFLTATIFDFTRDVMKAVVNANPEAASAGGAGVIASGATFAAGFSGAIATIASGLMTLVFGTGGIGLWGIVALVLGSLITLVIQAVLLLMVFLVRNVLIWVLLIAGPFAFAASVTPWFDSIRTQWLSMLVKVSFIQTVVASLLAVGILFISMAGQGDGFAAVIASVAAGVIAIKMTVDVPKDMLASAGLGQIANMPGAGDIAGSIGGGLTSYRKGRDKAKLEKIKRDAEWEEEHTTYDQEGKKKKPSRVRRFLGKSVGGTLKTAAGLNQREARKVEWEKAVNKAKSAGKVSYLSNVHDAIAASDKNNIGFGDRQKMIALFSKVEKNKGKMPVLGEDGKPMAGTTLREEMEKYDPTITDATFKDYKSFALALDSFTRAKMNGDKDRAQAYLQTVLGGSGYSKAEELLGKISEKV